MSLRRVVVITGCDTGLGWAIAARAARAGLVTVAGMRSGINTDAEQHLASYKALTVQLDVTDGQSVDNLKEYLNKLLMDNPNYRLYAVINNAGVMTVGDFEWQTTSMIESQISVNLVGAMRVTSALLPTLRRAALEGSVKPRLINIASHCGLQPLPAFSVYSASKSALLAWTRALRVELQPCGVHALAFIPGGFVTASKIMSRHLIEAEEMAQHLDSEQRSYYINKLEAIKQHLNFTADVPEYSALQDDNMIEILMSAVNCDKPKMIYKNESWRYKLYFMLFNLPLPEFLHNWLVKSFVSFPVAK